MPARSGAISSQSAAATLTGSELLIVDQNIGSPVAASALVVGQGYRITVLGTTTWQDCGAGAGAAVGTVFTCEAAGTGTGTAQQVDTRRVSASLLLALANVAGAITAHEAAADPHPEYLTQTEANAAFQPLDADLTALAALAGQTTYGRALLTLADQAALLAASGGLSSADPRLADVTQAAAEGGTGADPRFWSPMRWSQAAAAWLLRVSGEGGRAVLAAADAAAARDAIDLGTTDAAEFGSLTVSGISALAHIHGDIAGSLYAHVKNTSGVVIAAGTPLRITGTVGDTTTLEVAPAAAGSSATMPALFVARESLAVNAQGHAVMIGEITGMNTAGLTAGAPLWVSSAGGVVTATKPGANAQQVATVGRVHGSGGSIYVLPWPIEATGGSSAPEIGQAAAEAGTSTTAGIWSPERWRQAAVAWLGGISSAFMRGVLTAADAATARTALSAETVGAAATAQAYAIQRDNHTGEQPQSTITGLIAALSGKVDSTDFRLSDARTPTDGSVTTTKVSSSGLDQTALNGVAVTSWAPNTSFSRGALVDYGGVVWRRNSTGTTASTFNSANWSRQTTLPPSIGNTNHWISPIENGRVNAGTSQVAGTIYFHAFILRRGIKVSEIAARVATGVTSSNFAVAIYGSSNGEPIGAPIGQSGSMSGAANANVSSVVASQFELQPGILYFWGSQSDISGITFMNLANDTLTTASLVGSSTLANAMPATTYSVVFRTITGQTYGTWPTLTAGQTTETLSSSIRGLLPFFRVASFLDS